MKQMLEEASSAGFGPASSLERKFVQFEQDGLIGHPVRKENRRGGAGLWHPLQSNLFRFHLRNRREGISPLALANVPIGLWLFGEEGVETEQAQRALFFIGGSFLPVNSEDPIRGTGKPSSWPKDQGDDSKSWGDRSLLARNAKELVDRLSLPTTRPGARDRFARVLRRMTDGIPDTLVPQDQFVGALQGANPSISDLTGAAAYAMLSDRLLALSYLALLCSHGAEVRQFWESIRKAYRLSVQRELSPDYQTRQPRDQALVFPIPSPERFLSNASGILLSWLGLGIRALRGDRRISPSDLRLDPSLAKLFS